jgi:integrase
VSFETIRETFATKYLNFLKSQGQSHNSITKDFKSIKAIMNKAVKTGLTNNIEYQREAFSMSYKDADAVYLSYKEIQQLYNCNFSNDKRLENVRDLFVFGCLVGLRFKDFSNIKPENIFSDEDELFLRVNTSKTNEYVVIPCHPVVLEIFNKYQHNKNRLPRALCNQKFNEYIKEACKKAKLTEKGRLLTEPSKELYNCISSHTCRRSFATNLYLHRVPVRDIMKLTGHRTEKAFLNYIKVSPLENAKRIGKRLKSGWKRNHLRQAS